MNLLETRTANGSRQVSHEVPNRKGKSERVCKGDIDFRESPRRRLLGGST